MKIIVLGDIHGRTCWKDVVKRETFDKIIFLGDYVSTHEHIDEETQIKNLYDILEYKEANPDKVVLLRGNHDLQHLGFPWAECSGLFRGVLSEMIKIRDRFLNDTQWIYIKDNIIFSHAGISTRWMELNGIENIEDINNLEANEIFGFTPCKFSDYTGISPTQPPTWIRPWTLIDYMPEGYKQVVGHTPTRTHEVENRGDVWMCDCLPYEYLCIEDKFTNVKI